MRNIFFPRISLEGTTHRGLCKISPQDLKQDSLKEVSNLQNQFARFPDKVHGSRSSASCFVGRSCATALTVLTFNLRKGSCIAEVGPSPVAGLSVCKGVIKSQRYVLRKLSCWKVMCNTHQALYKISSEGISKKSTDKVLRKISLQDL